MSKEREILQRFHAGASQRNIALGLHVSRNTVAKVIAAYKSSNISSLTSHDFITQSRKSLMYQGFVAIFGTKQ